MKCFVSSDLLSNLVASIDADTLYKLRAEIYTKFFLAAPAGKDLLKQSNTYRHVIADKVFAMVLDMYRAAVAFHRRCRFRGCCVGVSGVVHAVRVRHGSVDKECLLPNGAAKYPLDGCRSLAAEPLWAGARAAGDLAWGVHRGSGE